MTGKESADRKRPYIACACVSMLVVIAALGGRARASDIADLLSKMPAATLEENEKLGQSLAATGAEGVRELVAMLKPPATGGDREARFALHAIALHVSRPDVRSERAAFAEAVAAELGRDHHAQTKAFLIRQLRIAGGAESLQAIGAALAHDELCEDAAQALMTIGIGANAPLREALLSATGKRRLTIMQALATLRDEASVETFMNSLRDSDREIRLAALHGLANMGALNAADALFDHAASASGYEKWRAMEACLLMAHNLSQTGPDRLQQHLRNYRQSIGATPSSAATKSFAARAFEISCLPVRYVTEVCVALRGMAQDKKRTAVAESVYRRLWDDAASKRHVKCAALQGLADVLGSAAFEQLRDAMRSDDPQIKAVATEAAITMPGAEVTLKWVAELERGNAESKIGTLAILARRKDKAALGAVLSAMKEADEKIRSAAIAAVSSLGGIDAIAPLVAVLASQNANEGRAAKLALQQVEGDGVEGGIADALDAAPAKVKSDLLDVLSTRGATSQLDRVVAYTSDADEAVRKSAIEALGALGGADTLPQVLDLLVAATSARVMSAAEKSAASISARVDDPDECATKFEGAMRDAPPTAKASLLRLLAKVGGDVAFAAVKGSWQSGDAEIMDAAVRALADWPDSAAASVLLDIAKNAGKLTHQVLALRGYVRILGLPSDRTSVRSLEMYQEAMEVATRPEEKKMVLGGFGKVPHLSALQAVTAYLGKDEYREEASAAIVNIARGIGGEHPQKAKDALDQVIRTSKNEHTRKQAQEVVDYIERFSDYVTSWMVSGPYTKAGIGGDKLLDVPFPPEEPDAKAKWQSWTGSGDRLWYVDFMNIPGISGDQRAVYVRAHIKPPSRQEAMLELGSDDALKVWINGKVVHDNNSMRGYTDAQDKVKITLDDGWNTILMKITQGGGGWATGCRVRGADGERIRGLRIKAE